MNETSSTQISIEDLTDLGLRCLSAMGLDDDERRIVNDVLMLFSYTHLTLPTKA